MNKWICPICGLYIKVDYSNIEIGDEVEFKAFIDNSFANFIFLRGLISKKENSYLYVSTFKGLFVVNQDEVYPADAPVRFIYNMFGECNCL